MYLNLYVLEKLAQVWVAERRAEAARIAAIEAASAVTVEDGLEATPAVGRPKISRASRWIELQFGR